MKFNIRIFATIILIFLQLTFSIKKAGFLNLIKKDDNLAKNSVVAPPAIESTTFWLQKFYPGKDPIKYLEESWKKPEKKYFVLNNSSIYFGKNELTNAIIEDLYDKDNDSASEGKCCKRMKYMEFDEVKLCDGQPCDKLYPDGKITDEQRDNDPFMARFCLDLEVYDVAHWRICHRSKNEIQRLRMNVVTQTIKQQVPSIDPNVMYKAPEAWTWIEQNKWGGNCDSQHMQSPVPIKIDPVAESTQPRFGFTYNFANSIPFVVRKNQDEVIIDFLSPDTENGKLTCMFGQFDVNVKDFHPYRMVFRFPAEHTINDNRYDGEIVVMFNERIDNKDKKIALLEGFNWVIPIKFDSNAHLIKELEQLMPDFWKFELENVKEYKPVDIKSGKPQHFDLMYFFDRIKPLKTDFALYLGSETTPPCIDGVMYLINFKPLLIANCQFKIFRENSLTTNRERETHARELQTHWKPEIRRITFGSITPNPRPIPTPVIPVPPPMPNPKKKLEWPGIKLYKKTPPLHEVDRTPNCELKRELNR